MHRMSGRPGSGRREGLGRGWDVGPRPWVGPPRFGPLGGGLPGGRGRGQRARRGDIRAAALLLLAEEPRNGYQIMQVLRERSGGAWRPSSGAVYPALQQLEDEGLIRAAEHGGRKRYELTDAGRRYVERDLRGPAPWDELADAIPDDDRELMESAHQVGMAALQVVEIGTPAQLAAARRILVQARRDLYRVLADDAPESGDDAVSPSPDAGERDSGDQRSEP